MTKKTPQLRITVDQDIHFGKPCIAGTRITVADVLELVEAGIPFDEITKKYYPDLTTDDVRACIRYALNLIEAEEIHVSAS